MATVQLGQFTDENAEAVIKALDDAGIGFYTKSFGRIVRVLFAADWGTRVFVDDADLERAMGVARSIAPNGVRTRKPLRW